MEWLGIIGDTFWQALAWLVGLAIGFGLLGWLMPCNRGAYWWMDVRAAATDLLYWFVTPLLVRVSRVALLSGGMTLLFGNSALGFAFVRDLPIAVQCLAVLILQDVMLYWIHRGFHTRSAWRFHAVHHSPTRVDWLSASRNHIVNLLLSFVLVDIVVQLLGFSPAALVILAPINIIYSSMVHANLNWTFGPLRYVFASPVFHRWHHTVEEEGIDKNFASTFPILDVIFGTFYMPADRLPERYGIREPEFPDDFFGQLIYPFTTWEGEAPAEPVALARQEPHPPENAPSIARKEAA